MNEYILDNPLPGSTTFEGGYLRKGGRCLTRDDGDTVSIQDCIAFIEEDELDNVGPIKSQTWIIEPRDIDYTTPPEEIEEPYTDLEFIIRSTCTELILDHESNLVDLQSCIDEDNECYNYIRICLLYKSDAADE